MNDQLTTINNKFRPYLLQLAYVVVGTIILISVSWISKNMGINPTIPTLILFVIGYLAITVFLKVLPSVKAFWRLEKIYLLVTGVVAGIIIQGIPVFLTHPVAFGKETFLNLLN